MPLTKVGPKFQITIPKESRKALGIQVGDLIDAKSKGNMIVLRPQVVLDKASIEKRLAEAEEDIKKGRVSPPFRSAKTFLRALHRDAGRLKKHP